jgi:hypothetical protein
MRRVGQYAGAKEGKATEYFAPRGATLTPSLRWMIQEQATIA